MQYESIILELMSRIKALEEKILVIEQKITEIEMTRNEDGGVTEEDSTARVKMTKEMMQACYECGCKLDQSENFDLSQELNQLTERLGMNRNSAIMYIYAVRCMLHGEIYKRAINRTATELFFENILRDFKKQGLTRALQATRMHILYRKQCGHAVDSLETLCQRYETLL